MPGFRIPSIVKPASIVLLLLVPSSIIAQPGGRFRGGGMAGMGFRGGFPARHIGGFPGGFGGFRGGFATRGGFHGTFLSVGRSPYFHRSFFPGNRFVFAGRRSFFGYPRFGFGLSFGYGYYPGYSYFPPNYTYYSPPVYVPAIVEPAVRYAESYRGYDREADRVSTKDRYWLISLKDHTIQAATDYWLEDSTLHYVTREGTKSSVELAGVDLEFTKELNSERGLEFQLPRPATEYRPQRRDSYGRPY